MTISTPPKHTFENPLRKAKYYCFSQIGQGGFGCVWKGITNFGLPIAVKVWKPTSNPQRDFLGWFNEQSLYLRCLSHPHVVSTYDQFTCTNGALVIVMELAEGSLEDYVVARGAVDPMKVCSIGIQLCNALEYIHSLRVIHRDITARNILYFPNDVFKISDFGISKQTVSPEEFARTLIGFKNAIPPELLTQGFSTTQSDIYQLGLVLLHLLTGEEAIPYQDIYIIRQMIIDGIPRQKAEALVTKQGKIAEVISIMLRRRSEFRYKTAAEVRAALQAGIAERAQKNINGFLSLLKRPVAMQSAAVPSLQSVKLALNNEQSAAPNQMNNVLPKRKRRRRRKRKANPNHPQSTLLKENK